jgi:hypothetical protein
LEKIMNVFRVLGTALLAGGIFLLVFGIMATHKVTEKVVEGVTGHYSDTTLWYIIGGIVLMVVGGIVIGRKYR